MALITRQAKGSKLTIAEMDGNLLWVNNLTEVTYSELQTLISESSLNPGQHYLITDYRTCYDRPDYNIYKSPIAVSNDSYVEESIDPIIVLAISADVLAVNAYQPSYPNDEIKYDVSYTLTESGNPAYGRITERIDEWGNRTDYDHRTINFKRYRLRTYNRYNPLAGTVELLVDGTVTGSATNFTALSPGQAIAIRFSNETFYEIVSVTDDFTMTVTGSAISPSAPGYQIFDANSHSYDSYYANNIDGQEDFSLYNTFEASYAFEGDGCINTHIGDHVKYFINEGNADFLLANNVLKDGGYENNTIGDSSYNNTFNDDCTSNRIGYAFRNNITDDDFDSNVIGDFFENNIITANFQYNQIGRNFEDNVILCDSFYRNRIGNDFRDNWLDGDWGFDFQNNNIGNQFNNNVIYKSFYKNFILNGYNDNENWDEFRGNEIGNAFNNNNIYCQFYENDTLDYFESNTLGDSGSIGSYTFSKNRINTNYYNNNILGTFSYNEIGSYFENNTIGDGFGYGYSTSQGNKIGNYFYGNTIGEYFYNNVVADGFYSNTITDYFQLNDVKYSLYSTDFTSATHVYGNYNCTLFLRSDNSSRLSYVDNSDVINYVGITS